MPTTGARWLLTLLIFGLFALSAVPARTVEPGMADAPDFDRVVAPLLARHCLDCHSGADPKGKLNLASRAAALQGGEGGPALVAGNVEESTLWERVSSNEMPPKHPLSPAEKETLKAWIEAGATWGTDPIDPFQVTTNRRAGRDWWSLQPLTRPAPPDDLANPGWCRTPIDRFILARLNAEQLVPTPEADRLTLVRRLAFDLTGLPPTSEQINAFLADDQPGAYERLVNRLLDSPQYGVHQARKWLDLARYGESNGFEYDEFRPNAWRYRDWVVQAINEDLPYNTFARLQLAGDVLEPENPGSVEATGFLAAAAYDTAGQNQQSAAMKAVVRQDELEDLIGTTGQTFLGLTLNCARCHDHKFDPVYQSEYYRFAAALAGVRQGERDLSAIDPVRKQWQARLAELEARRIALEQPIRQAIQAEQGNRPTSSMAPEALLAWDFTKPDDGNSSTGPALTLHNGARRSPEGLHVGGPEGGYVSSAPLEISLKERTLEAWIKLDTLDQGGGAALSLQTVNSAVFDAIVYGERQPHKWMAGSDGFVRTKDLAADAEQEAAAGPVHVAITYAVDGTITVYRNGVSYAPGYQTSTPVEFAAGASQVLFGLRHGPPDPKRVLNGTIVRARIYDRALTPGELAESYKSGGQVITPEQIAARLTATERETWEQLRTEAAASREQLKAAQVRKAYALTPRTPEPTHVLMRGNPGQPANEVTPGAVAAVTGVTADFGLPANAPDAHRRARLAAWITDPANPLFARVIVNRVWQGHFGTGLVETSSDFGFNGTRPTHPELLDWLAGFLIENGWSVKALHREIVNSAVYRQGSAPHAQALQVDANNRWLWRHTPARLEAEMVRDAMFATAGELDGRLGGPSFQDYVLTPAKGTGSVHYLATDPGTPGFNRRTLYRAWTRGGRNAFLDSLDCPDPSTTAPRRNVTNTPLQALSLMNNALVLHLANRFAARLEREAGTDPAQVAALAYQLALGRPPSDAEQQEAAATVRQFGAAVLARALFNSNAFLYVD